MVAYLAGDWAAQMAELTAESKESRLVEKKVAYLV